MAGSVNGIRTPISQTTPDLSRRTILVGVPAAAIGVGALAAPAFAAAPHPDAALLALEPLLKPLNDQYDRAAEVCEAAKEAYAAERDALPKKRRKRPSELERLRIKHRVDETDAVRRTAADRVNACYREFTRARAKTLDGLKAKARWAEDSDSMPLAIVRDLLAM